MNNKRIQIDITKASALARSYSPLLYHRKLQGLLEAVYADTDFGSLDKYGLHQHVNQVLSKSYCGEHLVKYKIAKKYITKDTVGAFEVKVGNSRADFVSINGVSRCYEIKTKLDNLSKLAKQSAAYAEVFEYNTVVLDDKHLEQAKTMLPLNFGLAVICAGKLKTVRKAVKNEQINPMSQLMILTSRERLAFFGNDGEIDCILEKNSAKIINRCFKIALKKRYLDQWSFVKVHRQDILPIDFQFFFSTKEAPSLVYQRVFR